MINKIVLIAGGNGFLGRHTAAAFKRAGFDVWAIGHGSWGMESHAKWGIDRWISAELTMDSLSSLEAKPAFIINCAGSSSVGISFEKPLIDFKKTVDGTMALLEYIRLKAPEAKLVQLSSPAVQGRHADTPIMVNDPKDPVSPYGLHKSLAEELCFFYSKAYGLNVAIIRFFSLYGPGLKKQLLWDACNKFKAGPQAVEFGGSGNETRDWLYVDDAVDLILKVAQDRSRTMIFNGGTGRRLTVREALSNLAQAFDKGTKITFHGLSRPGDPQFYLADIKDTLKLGWSPNVSLEEGIGRYVDWFKKEAM